MVRNIADDYHYLGQYYEALVWHQRALTTRERIPGKDLLSVVAVINDIGSVYNKKGQYDEVLVWYLLDGKETTSGKEHRRSNRATSLGESTASRASSRKLGCGICGYSHMVGKWNEDQYMSPKRPEESLQASD